MPGDLRGRLRVLEWLFWQVGGLGPMAGQNHHFAKYAPARIPYAIERYRNETSRLYGVLDRELAKSPYVAGDYSIADIACYPWIAPHVDQGQDLDDFPHLKRWFTAVKARPAVARAYAAGRPMRVRGRISPRSNARSSLARPVGATDRNSLGLRSANRGRIGSVAAFMSNDRQFAAEETAKALIEVQAVFVNTRKPFITTAGWASPVYIDMRRIIGFPRLRRRLIDFATRAIERDIGYESLDVVAGGETAGIPFAAWIADSLMLPMQYVRKKPKGFGRNARIEGDLRDSAARCSWKTSPPTAAQRRIS